MRLISVNVGAEETIQGAKSSGKTGIFKRPSAVAVAVNKLGLQGDHINDTENHGGEDQAVYVYGLPDYAWWSQELGYELEPGTFGENLTVSDLESATLNIGDRLSFVEVVLEVTAPRIPCVTLAARMGDPTFVKRFRYAERPGVYCRVIQPGQISADELVTLTRYPDKPVVTALELFRLFYEPDNSETMLRRILAAPIDVRGRQHYENELAKVLSGAAGA